MECQTNDTVPICPHCNSNKRIVEFDDAFPVTLRIKNKNPPYNRIDFACHKGFACLECKELYLDSDDFAETIGAYKMISGDENFEPSLEEVKNSEIISEKIETFMSEMRCENAS